MGKTGVGCSGTCRGTDPAPPANQLDTNRDLAIQGLAAWSLKVAACYPSPSPSQQVSLPVFYTLLSAGKMLTLYNRDYT